jgi:hypothetical protein
MNKWADYLISAVRYKTDSSSKVIAYFKVHTDNGNSIGESITWSKEELLEALVKGNSFVTIIKKENGKWTKGMEVTISSNKEIFVRTDFRNIPEDLLESLPEF